MCPAAAGGGAASQKPRFLCAARWAGQEPGSSAHTNSRSNPQTTRAISATMAGFRITMRTPTDCARRSSAESMQPVAMTTAASGRMASTACASSTPLMPPGIVKSVSTSVKACGSRLNAASASSALANPWDEMPSFSSARVIRNTSVGSSST